MQASRLTRGPLRGPLQKTALLICLAALVYAVPFAGPVKPAVSLSYVVNFSNRTAVLLFLGGTLLFSVLTAGEMARSELADSTLSLRSLFMAEAFVLVVCLLLLWAGGLGGEAQYVVHREQMLAAGRHLYTQTDYLYGPVLIMPGIWLARIFHISMVSGYLASHVALWLAGVWMIWFVIRSLSLTFRYRAGLFAAIIALESTGIIAQGTHYTPVRRFTASVAACLLFAVSARTRNEWKIATAGIVGTVVCLLVSPEQAIGFTAGALAWLVLCRVRSRPGFSLPATAFFAAGAAVAFGIAAWSGMFREMLTFAAGGFAFPLVPTVETLLILFVYAAGVAACWRAIVRRQETSENTVLLCLAGMAMIPAAMGRCDLGHLWSAIPLTLVGSASLLTMSALRRWFVAVALIVLVLPLGYTYLLWPVAHAVKQRYLHGSSPAASLPEISFATLPCDRSYYAPELLLKPDAPYRLGCVDLGYKRGLSDIYTAGEIADQITEIAERREQPLLLSNHPFNEIFKPHEYDTYEVLQQGRLEGKWPFFIPRDRNPPLSFQPIGDYILAHYTPGPTILDGQVRIWYPKP